MANTYRVPNLEQDLDFVGTNRLVQLAGVISLLSVAFSCAPASSLYISSAAYRRWGLSSAPANFRRRPSGTPSDHSPALAGDC
jgi:hypothetical protein